MGHLPIYRASTRRSGARFFQWRRTASWGAAAAALTLSGIALGYRGFSEQSTEAPPVAIAGITVPVPMVTLPLTDGGHPDVISVLSSALLAHIQAAPAPVQQLLFGPLGPLLGPQPVAMTVEPVDFSAVVDEPMAVMLDEVPVDETPVEADAMAAPEDPVVEPTFTPLLAAPRTLTFATVAIAPADDEPQQVQSAVEAPPPAPDPPSAVPAASSVAPAKPPTVAQVAPPPALRPQLPEPAKAEPTQNREKPAQEVKHPVPEKKNGNANDNKNNNDKGGKGDSSKHGD